MKAKMVLLAVLFFSLILGTSIGLLTNQLSIPNIGIIGTGGVTPSRLHVDGSALKDSAGNVVPLRGVVSDAMVDGPYYYGFWDSSGTITDPQNSARKLTYLEAFVYRVKNQGANCIAFGFWYGWWFINTPISSGSWDPWNGKPQNAKFMSALDNIAAACHKFGVYYYFRTHFSGSPYPDIQRVLEDGDYYTPGQNQPLWLSNVTTARQEWCFYLSGLTRRFMNDPYFVGITLFNEPPTPGDGHYATFTWDDYITVYGAGEQAIHSVSPEVIAIMPTWQSFNAKFPTGHVKAGQYVFPVTQWAGKQVMYYWHFYSFFCWRDTSKYPFVSYYQRGSTTANTTEAKTALAAVLNTGTVGMKAFQNRGGCPLQDEAGWYSEAQEPPYQVYDSNGILVDEGGTNWRYLMQHFFEIHNEWQVSWVYFDTFGRYRNPAQESTSLQGYGLFENAEDGGTFPWMKTRQGGITYKSVLWPQLAKGRIGTPLGLTWTQALSSGFEPPALVKSYLYTDPPIAGGWTENDVGPGTLQVVNTFSRSGSQSMYGTAVTGESMAAEIYRNPSAKGLKINAWFYYKAGTNRDRVIIWFECAEEQTMQYLRLRVKSAGDLEIAVDSKITGFPAPPLYAANIQTGQWVNLEAWVLMDKNTTPQKYVEVGVKLNGVEIFKKTATDLASVSIPSGYGAMNAVEIGPWGNSGLGTTEVWVDDVTIWLVS